MSLWKKNFGFDVCPTWFHRIRFPCKDTTNIPASIIKMSPFLYFWEQLVYLVSGCLQKGLKMISLKGPLVRMQLALEREGRWWKGANRLKRGQFFFGFDIYSRTFLFKKRLFFFFPLFFFFHFFPHLSPSFIFNKHLLFTFVFLAGTHQATTLYILPPLKLHYTQTDSPP